MVMVSPAFSSPPALWRLIHCRFYCCLDSSVTTDTPDTTKLLTYVGPQVQFVRTPEPPRSGLY